MVTRAGTARAGIARAGTARLGISDPIPPPPPPPGSPPTAPSSLSVALEGSTAIRLTWTDNSSDENSFKIERKVAAGAFSQIATVAANVVTYLDTGLSASTLYTYRVRAFNGLDSTYSNEDSETTPALPSAPAAPSSLATTLQGDDAISMTWVDNANNEDEFRLERKVGAGSFVEIATLPANTTSHQDTGLAAGTLYSYRIRAYNGQFSSYSNTDSETTPNPPDPGDGQLQFTTLHWGSVIVDATMRSFSVSLPFTGGYDGSDLNPPVNEVPLIAQIWFKKSSEPDQPWDSTNGGWRKSLGSSDAGLGMHRVEKGTLRQLRGAVTLLDPGTTYSIRVLVEEDVVGGAATPEGTLDTSITTQTDAAGNFHNVTDFSPSGPFSGYTHRYVDATAGGSGDGTLGNPWNSLLQVVTDANATAVNKVYHFAPGSYARTTTPLAPPADKFVILVGDNSPIDYAEDGNVRNANGFLIRKTIVNSGDHTVFENPPTQTPAQAPWTLTQFTLPSEYQGGTNPLPTTLYMWKRTGTLALSGLHCSTSSDPDQLVRVPTYSVCGTVQFDNSSRAWYIDGGFPLAMSAADREAHMVATLRTNATQRYGAHEYNGAVYCMVEPYLGAPTLAGQTDELGNPIVDLNQLYFWNITANQNGAGAGLIVNGKSGVASANQPRVRISGIHFRQSQLQINGLAHGTVVDHCLFNGSGNQAGCGAIHILATNGGNPTTYAQRPIIQYCYIRDTGSWSTVQDATGFPSVSWRFIKNNIALHDGKIVAGDGAGAWRLGNEGETHGLKNADGGAQLGTMRWCHIDGKFNGVNGGTAKYNTEAARNWDVYDCIVENCADNAFEPESSGDTPPTWASFWKIWGNEIYNVLTPFACSPAHGGVHYVFRNLWWDYNRNGIRHEEIQSGANQGQDPTGRYSLAPKIFKFGPKYQGQGRFYFCHNTVYTTSVPGHVGKPDGGGQFSPQWYLKNNLIVLNTTNGDCLDISMGSILGPNLTLKYGSGPANNPQKLQYMMVSDYNFWSSLKTNSALEFNGQNLDDLATWRTTSGATHDNFFGGQDRTPGTSVPYALLQFEDLEAGDARLLTTSDFRNAGTPLDNISDQAASGIATGKDWAYSGAAPDMGWRERT